LSSSTLFDRIILSNILNIQKLLLPFYVNITRPNQWKNCVDFPRLPATATPASLPDLLPAVPGLQRPPNPAKLSSLSFRLDLICHIPPPLSYPPTTTSVKFEPSLAKSVLISFLPKPKPCSLSVTVLQTLPSGRPDHAGSISPGGRGVWPGANKYRQNSTIYWDG
jgi:hypothetical protein